MKKVASLLLIIAGAVALAAAFKVYFLDSAPTQGALQINSIPKANVYLDGKDVGQTPLLLEKIPPKEYDVKLIAPANIWESKAKVPPGAMTYISREMGVTEENSAGQVLTLEKLPSAVAVELAIVSDPDGSVINIDGLEKGRTSTIIRNLTAGDKAVVISLPGYADQIIHAQLASGYRLNALVKLRRISIEKVAPLPEPVASVSATITVKETPIGFLRVRSAPNVNASESGRIQAGQKYLILEEASEWVKIKFNNSEGWIWKDYVTISR